MDEFNIWHSEWPVKVQRLKRGKITISFIPRCDRSKSLKSRPLVLSSSSGLLFFLLSSFRSQQVTNKARYDAICVQECPNLNIWGYGLRSKRFEGSRFYSKIMLGLQATKRGAPGSPRKNI